MSDSHHIKTYLVFFLISCLFVGVLAYLYMPGSFFGLKSDVLSTTPEEKISSEPLVIGENPAKAQIDISSEVSADNGAQKRLRLTNLLLHYQTELGGLESDKTIAGADIEKQQKIFELRVKIDSLQAKITSLAH